MGVLSFVRSTALFNVIICDNQSKVALKSENIFLKTRLKCFEARKRNLPDIIKDSL